MDSLQTTAHPLSKNLRFPAAIVFVSSFCLMVIELVAGRMVAPYVGVSIYTWTSIIGIILGGIALGNYIGGRLADDNPSRSGLGIMLIIAGIASFSSLFIVPFLGETLRGSGLSLPLATLLFSGAAFLPASVFLGCVSPYVVKCDLSSLDCAGRTVGRIYAVGTVGSILGTFGTGFLFISSLGTQQIILIVSLALVFTGLMVIGSGGIFKNKPLLAVLPIFLTTAFVPSSPCLQETQYFCVQIKEFMQKGKRVASLKLDHLVHSYVHLDDPAVLGYDYEKVYAIAVKFWQKVNNNLEGSARLRTLSLGAGGYTVPRYLENYYPAADIEVVEIDPKVTEINHTHLELPRSTRITTVNADARRFLNELPPEKRFDIIFGDAFNDFTVPYHLTTAQFVALVRGHLAPGGIYAANVIDDMNYGRFLASMMKTIRSSFEYVYLAPLQKNLIESGRNTWVIIGMNEPMQMSLWNDAFESLRHEHENGYTEYTGAAARLIPYDQAMKVLEEKRPILLSDDYAPTDNLLAPLFKDWYR